MSNSQFCDGAIAVQQLNNTSSCLTEGTSGGKSHKTSSESADEEQEEPSSSSSNNDVNSNVQDELTAFRNEWQNEISIGLEEKNRISRDERSMTVEDIETRAKTLFMQGIDHEEKGHMYDAIQCYRKAVQLVPDVEFKLDESSRINVRERTESSEIMRDHPDFDDNNVNTNNFDEDEEGENEVKLVSKLHRWLSRSPALCMPATEQKATHISSLPLEIMLVIFRWVVSSDLDIRSLETCGLVCRGFYLCSRDSEIWRLICARLWVNGDKLLTNNQLTWRDIYLTRPHLKFGGCYISKTSYVRRGETNFQDRGYRPWHVVEYYRYLRFFPEGKVLMLTTPDAPQATINHLRQRSPKNPAVMSGCFQLSDDKVTLILTRTEWETDNNRYTVKNRRVNVEETKMKQNFKIELEIQQVKKKVKLVWKKYRVITVRGATETDTNFEVTNNKFSAFSFSPVKSYCADSAFPLT